jgi:protein-tyrosine phosphatase
MAHAMAADWAQKNGKAIEFASCGTRVTHGAQTTADARLVLAQSGIPWCGTSQQLQAEDLRWADHVWVMTQEHLEFVVELGHSVNVAERPSVQLLHPHQEITDPLGLGVKSYHALYAQLEALLPTRLVVLHGP